MWIYLDHDCAYACAGAAQENQMATFHLSQSEREYIVSGVREDLRADGRTCTDYRHFKVRTGVVSNTSGSAKIELVRHCNRVCMHSYIDIAIKKPVIMTLVSYPDQTSLSCDDQKVCRPLPINHGSLVLFCRVVTVQ